VSLPPVFKALVDFKGGYNVSFGGLEVFEVSSQKDDTLFVIPYVVKANLTLLFTSLLLLNLKFNHFTSGR